MAPTGINSEQKVMKLKNIYTSKSNAVGYLINKHRAKASQDNSNTHLAPALPPYYDGSYVKGSAPNNRRQLTTTAKQQ